MIYSNYEDTRRTIENSSWYKEITERNFSAAQLVGLSKERFRQELQATIDRHKRQQVHIDILKKKFCRQKSKT